MNIDPTDVLFLEEPIKSYYKNLTLQKNYGSTGSVETVDGAFYIGRLDIWTTDPSVCLLIKL